MRLKVGGDSGGATDAGGTADAGGTIDRTAEVGRTYRYSAQRVRVATVAGEQLELRSAPSSVVTVEVKDAFAPETPVGLVAVSALAGEAASRTPAIDLSWEPDMEPRVAGYRVYRRDLDGSSPEAWKRLGAELTPGASYRDQTVQPGHKYAYRVTAVSDAGAESAPGNEVVETAPAAR